MLIVWIGSILATVGDLLMLWVGNAARPELSLARPPEAMLWMGALLGLVGLPMYGFGYVVLQRRHFPDNGFLSRLTGTAGMAVGVVGAGVHGYTALLIKMGLDAPVAVNAAPADAVLASGPLLLSLWALTLVALLLAVGAFVALQVKRRQGLRIETLCNPVVLTVLLVLIGGTTPLLGAFLLPAAPNLAHVLFFGLLLRSASAEPVSAA